MHKSNHPHLQINLGPVDYDFQMFKGAFIISQNISCSYFHKLWSQTGELQLEYQPSKRHELSPD